MVMEVLDVYRGNESATEGCMNRGRGMRRKRKMISLANMADLEKVGDAAATRDVCLQNIYRLRFNQQPCVIEYITILASGDVHHGRSMLHEHMKPNAIV